MARRRANRARHGHGAEGEESNERWLLTYADMITLLMALFMVLFSISSVNISKYKTLQQALREAFSGQILTGGSALEQAGATKSSSHVPSTTSNTTVMPFAAESAHRLAKSPFGTITSAAQEQQGFERLKHEIDAYASHHALTPYVQTAIEPRGLVIRLLTDRLLFPSGLATLSPSSYPLLAKIASLLTIDRVHPIAVEGYTDSLPIHTNRYPSNWELSTARASTVVRFLIGRGVTAKRLSAIGYAEQRPIASNATPAGRARNRRVEIVLQRLYPPPAKGG